MHLAHLSKLTTIKNSNLTSPNPTYLILHIHLLLCSILLLLLLLQGSSWVVRVDSGVVGHSWLLNQSWWNLGLPAHPTCCHEICTPGKKKYCYTMRPVSKCLLWYGLNQTPSTNNHKLKYPLNTEHSSIQPATVNHVSVKYTRCGSAACGTNQLNILNLICNKSTTQNAFYHYWPNCEQNFHFITPTFNLPFTCNFLFRISVFLFVSENLEVLSLTSRWPFDL